MSSNYVMLISCCKHIKKYKDVIIMSNEDNIAPTNEDLNVVKY